MREIAAGFGERREIMASLDGGFRSAELEKKQLGGEKPLTYVYLCSAPHSGSTLIACILGAHPRISTVGEFGAEVSESDLCSCGKTYGDCPFWQEWVSRGEREGAGFQVSDMQINLQPAPAKGILDSAFYRYFPSKWIDRCRDIVLFAHPGRRKVADALAKGVRLVEILCRWENTRVFVDSMKNPFQVRFLAQHPRIHVKLIALVRDGRGVMNSLMRKEHWSPEQSIGSWLWSNRNLRRAARYLPPEDVFWVRLEDLCRNPEETCTALHRFCGVEAIPGMYFNPDKQLHIIGNGMRLSYRGEIKFDESWRRALAPEHLDLFMRRVGWLNRELGYED